MVEHDASPSPQGDADEASGVSAGTGTCELHLELVVERCTFEARRKHPVRAAGRGNTIAGSTGPIKGRDRPSVRIFRRAGVGGKDKFSFCLQAGHLPNPLNKSCKFAVKVGVSEIRCCTNLRTFF